MNQTCLEHNPEEIAEIEKHKYFLSEKAGHDIGWEVAEQDWESNHAEQFRLATMSESKAQGVRGVGTFLKRVLAKAGAR